MAIPATISAGHEHFLRWLDAGLHAGMDYLQRHREARRHPEAVLRSVKSILVLAVSYETVLESEDHPVKKLAGLAEYARGVDYHIWIRRRLNLLAAEHRRLFPTARCRGAVDTAPLAERQLALEAGIGWQGKNTLIVSPQFGSKFFLAELLSTAEFEMDAVKKMPDRCGSCSRCLDACPTGALKEPGVLDARRCLNYWTIEHQDPATIPTDIQDKRGKRFFGCDDCQKNCPWNKNRPTIPEGHVDPGSLDTDTLRDWATASPLERVFRAY